LAAAGGRWLAASRLTRQLVVPLLDDAKLMMGELVKHLLIVDEISHRKCLSGVPGPDPLNAVLGPFLCREGFATYPETVSLMRLSTKGRR
jgi:hypothetical protein